MNVQSGSLCSSEFGEIQFWFFINIVVHSNEYNGDVYETYGSYLSYYSYDNQCIYYDDRMHLYALDDGDEVIL